MVNLFHLAAGTKSCEEEIQVKLFPLLLVLPVSVSLANDTDARTCLSVCAPVFQRRFKEVVSYSKKILKSILYFVNYL